MAEFGAAFDEDYAAFGEYLSSNLFLGQPQWSKDVRTDSQPLAQFLGIPFDNTGIGNSSNTLVDEVAVDDAYRSTDTQSVESRNIPHIPTTTSTDTQQGISDSSSSWVITTPPLNSDREARSITPEHVENMFRAAVLHGPCSNTWKVPRLVRVQFYTWASSC